MVSKLLLSDLAGKIGAILQGPDVEVGGIAAVDEAGPGQVTFLSNPKYARKARETKASAIIAKQPIAGAGCAFLLTPDPYLAFALAVEQFHPPVRPAAGVSAQASVHPAAVLGKGVHVGPFAVIDEGAVIGDRVTLYPGAYVGKGAVVDEDTVLHPHVTLYEGVRIGKRVLLHAGCVIGSDGFGFAPTPQGFRKIPQVGTVEIGDDVEIGANTTIDRAALGVTRVGPGTKLDNLIQVGHNVEIGRDTVIAAQVGISGSVRIGNRVMIGGQSGLAGHLELGDGVMLGAKTGVLASLSADENRVWSGIPAMPHRRWLKMVALLPKLPELFRRVTRLEGGKPEKGEE
ncbi:UDP-3-O-(3-hydroxymyristoyl)glucosamine N-acyltransferase [Candidatus Deferrimicrobium sp.]|uniref:UDP-3-O-(3-hydroxymyristoyl)glucosamine N-acyltransferase n=1 Tax=Candidatus Deferrimicrobium sp. TaxID=3060586 RepID=UPI002ECFF2BD